MEEQKSRIQELADQLRENEVERRVLLRAMREAVEAELTGPSKEPEPEPPPAAEPELPSDRDPSIVLKVLRESGKALTAAQIGSRIGGLGFREVEKLLSQLPATDVIPVGRGRYMAAK